MKKIVRYLVGLPLAIAFVMVGTAASSFNWSGPQGTGTMTAQEVAITNTSVEASFSNVVVRGTATISGTTVLSGAQTVNGNMVVGGTLGASNTVTLTTNLVVNGTTASTSKDTGAIVTEGGLGVEKSAYIGTGLFVNNKAVTVSTNATGRMTLSGSTTTNTLTVAFPVPFAGTTVPIGIAQWADTGTVTEGATNWLRIACVSNQAVITHGTVANGGAYTNINFIIHGVAP